jgi:DNA (cytosine-5)-methyltransferase 1
MKMPAQQRGTSKQDYGTPPVFLDAVRRKFGPLVCDLAARADNAKCYLFIPPEVDSLAQDWNAIEHEVDGYFWLNPPFANIAPWAKKARGLPVLMLVPASVGSRWFAEHVYPFARVYALTPRLTFEGCTQPYPKDCILCDFSAEPGFEVWDWRK